MFLRKPPEQLYFTHQQLIQIVQMKSQLTTKLSLLKFLEVTAALDSKQKDLSKALGSIIYWTWHAIVCRNKSSFGLSIILISPQGHFSFLMVIVLHYQANTYIMFLGPQLVANLSPKFAVKMQKILFSRKQIARETIQLSMS